jgi:hypothetical protein
MTHLYTCVINPSRAAASALRRQNPFPRESVADHHAH